MKSRIWLGLLLALFAGHAWGAGGSSDVFIAAVANGPCTTWPKCPALPNDSGHPFYTNVVNQPTSIMLGGALPPFASTPTFNLGTLNGAALDSSLQSIFGLMPGKNGDGGALAHTTNGALETGGNLATVANAQGAQGTGSTFNPPAGGSGILGYLSGIYKAITGTLTVSGTVTSAPAQISLQNLDVTSLSGSAASTILATGHAGHGGWVSSTVAYCLNLTGTAGTVNNTPAGTSCFTANYIFVLPAMSGAVSMYGLSAGASYGQGSL